MVLLYTSHHYSIFHKSQEAEAPQMPIGSQMDKENVLCTYSSVLLSHKKETLSNAKSQMRLKGSKVEIK